MASPQPKLMEACLRCLRTVLSRKDAPIDVLYNDPSLIPHLVQLAKERSLSVQECVMTMLYCACQVKIVFLFFLFSNLKKFFNSCEKIHLYTTLILYNKLEDSKSYSFSEEWRI